MKYGRVWACRLRADAATSPRRPGVPADSGRLLFSTDFGEGFVENLRLDVVKAGFIGFADHRIERVRGYFMLFPRVFLEIPQEYVTMPVRPVIADLPLLEELDERGP